MTDMSPLLWLNLTVDDTFVKVNASEGIILGWRWMPD
jgi:hypothetical protein